MSRGVWVDRGAGCPAAGRPPAAGAGISASADTPRAGGPVRRRRRRAWLRHHRARCAQTAASPAPDDARGRRSAGPAGDGLTPSRVRYGRPHNLPVPQADVSQQHQLSRQRTRQPHAQGTRLHTGLAAHLVVAIRYRSSATWPVPLSPTTVTPARHCPRTVTWRRAAPASHSQRGSRCRSCPAGLVSSRGRCRPGRAAGVCWSVAVYSARAGQKVSVRGA
jgi:hypothetical protein